MSVAVRIALDAHETRLFDKLLRSRSIGTDFQTRVQIVRGAAQGLNNRQISAEYGIEVHRIGTWRNRFYQCHELWKTLDSKLRPKMNAKLIKQWLSDKPGRGRKAEITPEQKQLITALACTPPSQSGYPHTHWSLRLLTREVIKRRIVDTIAFQTVGSFLKYSETETAQKPVLVKRRN